MGGNAGSQNNSNERTDNSAELSALQDQIRNLTAKNSEYENLLLDPKYLDFVANGSGYIKAEKPSSARREETPAPASGEDPLESMSRKELIEYIVKNVQGVVRQEIEPMRKGAQFREVQAQVKDAAEAYPDFWDYKDEMINIAKANPNLNARQAYHIAKGETKGKPAKPARSGAVPSGSGETKTTTPKGFEAKFLEAWQQAGFGSKE